MSRIMLSLLSGLAVGLAFGLSASSSCQPGFPLRVEKEEALYRGQPACYWLQQLRDRDPAQRQQAMWALARLGPDPEHVRAVAELLADKDQGVRFGAALNLGRMGPAAASTVPQLLRALRDADQFVRVTAVRALGRICPQEDAVLVALSGALQDKSAMVSAGRWIHSARSARLPERCCLPCRRRCTIASRRYVRLPAMPLPRFDSKARDWWVALGTERSRSCSLDTQRMTPAGALREGPTTQIGEVIIGQEKFRLQEHEGSVWNVAFSPDGTTIASASCDKTVKLWDVRTGRQRATLRAHNDQVNGVM